MEIAETGPAQFVADILTQLETRGRVIAAIDGRCGAGKTTLARALGAEYGWSVISLDDFFLRPEQRSPARYAAPGENVDHERFLSEVLLPLTRGEPVTYRPFDCVKMILGTPVAVPESPVTLIEGSYALHPALFPHYHVTAFLDVAPEEQLRRIAARSPDRLEAFQTRWIPLEERYIAALRPDLRCGHRILTG